MNLLSTWVWSLCGTILFPVGRLCSTHGLLVKVLCSVCVTHVWVRSSAVESVCKCYTSRLSGPKLPGWTLPATEPPPWDHSLSLGFIDHLLWGCMLTDWNQSDVQIKVRLRKHTLEEKVQHNRLNGWITFIKLSSLTAWLRYAFLRSWFYCTSCQFGLYNSGKIPQITIICQSTWTNKSLKQIRQAEVNILNHQCDRQNLYLFALKIIRYSTVRSAVILICSLMNMLWNFALS